MFFSTILKSEKPCHSLVHLNTKFYHEKKKFHRDFFILVKYNSSIKIMKLNQCVDILMVKKIKMCIMKQLLSRKEKITLLI